MTSAKNLFSFVSTLSGVRRFSLMKQVHPENVLEHTGMVAIFAFVIGSQINRRARDDAYLERLLVRAIIHDFDEAVTGDVVRPTKYFSEAMRDECRKMEEQGIENIGIKLDLPRLSFHHWHSKRGPEGLIIAFADIMAAVHRLWEEVIISNNHAMAICAGHTLMALGKVKTEIDASTTLSPISKKILSEYYESLVEVLQTVEEMGGEFADMATKEEEQ